MRRLRQSLAISCLLLTPACMLDLSPESSAPKIDPQNAAIVTGAEFQFAVTSSAQAAWSVSEPTGGVITEEGIYTAPDEPGTYHVVASNNFGSDGATVSVIEAFVRLLKGSDFIPTALAETREQVALIGDLARGGVVVSFFEPATRNFRSTILSSAAGLSVRAAASSEDALVLVGTAENGHPFVLSMRWNGAVNWATALTNVTGTFRSASVSSNGDILAFGLAATDGVFKRPLVALVRSTGTPVWAKLGACEGCLASAAANWGGYRVVGGNKDSSNWLAAFLDDGTPAWNFEIQGAGNLFFLKPSQSGDRLVLAGTTDKPNPWVGFINAERNEVTVATIASAVPLVLSDIGISQSIILFGVFEDSPWLGALTDEGELAWQQSLYASIGGTTVAAGRIANGSLFGLGTFGAAEPMFFKLPTSGSPHLGLRSHWSARSTDFEVTVDSAPTSKGTVPPFVSIAVQASPMTVTQTPADIDFAD